MRITFTTTAMFFLLFAARAQQTERVQVYGRVIDKVTRGAVYATVEHYDTAGKRWSLTEVNSDGRYALFLPCDAPFELRITENGYRPFVLGFEAVPCGTTTFEADLMLTPFGQ